MRRRLEVWLIGGAALALVLAGILGQAAAPDPALRDQRLSTRLAGPAGAKALRATLERLGVSVHEQRRPLLRLADAVAPGPGRWQFVLNPDRPITTAEQRELRDWAARGGNLLLAGYSGVERCFGFEIVTAAHRGVKVRTETATGEAMPVPTATLRHLTEDDDRRIVQQRCEPPAVVAVERLWTRDGEPGAVRLRFASGGSALIVADPTLLRNETLRNTAAGPMALGWIMAEQPRSVMVDEYHHGFSDRPSLTGAVAAWSFRSPAGWMILQLLAAGLVALALAAVRFGPVVPAIDRRRRSSIEHLDALASGLQRGRAASTAARLLVDGLRRRLAPGAARSDQAAWLAGLSAAPSSAARDAAGRLRSALTTHSDDPDSDVLTAALAAEDVWNTLRSPTSSRS